MVYAAVNAPLTSLVVVVIAPNEDESVTVCDGSKPLPVKVTGSPALIVEGDADSAAALPVTESVVDAPRPPWSVAVIVEVPAAVPAGTVHERENAPVVSLVVDAIDVPVPDEDSVIVCEGLNPVPMNVTTLPAATVEGDAVNVGVVWAWAMPPMRTRAGNTAAVTAARREGIWCRVTRP